MLRLLTSLVFFAAVSCIDQPNSTVDAERLIDTKNRFERSSSAGNLLATALEETYDLDFVFVPSETLLEDQYALLKPGMDKKEVERQLMGLYDQGRLNYRPGTMRGRDIEDFLVRRTAQMLRHDLHVGGLTYEIQFEGGLPRVTHIRQIEGLRPLDPDARYRVAVEQQAYKSFPGYFFSQSLSMSFKPETETISAEQALKEYLADRKTLLDFERKRSEVILQDNGTVPGITSIAQIQGISHRSPYLAKTVTVQGIVTTAGSDRDKPGSYEGYLQDVKQDSDDRSSNGIYFDLSQLEDFRPKVGDLIELEAVVYEDLTNEGLTRTGLRFAKSGKILKSDQPLPAPVVIGGDFSRTVPNHIISSFRGNLNQKDELNLSDGIDFWESLEGMRIQVVDPVVIGFAGGLKDYSKRPKSYINVFVAADKTRSLSQVTPLPDKAKMESDRPALAELDVRGGLIIDNQAFDYNPEIIRVIDHHLAPNVRSSQLFNVGDVMKNDLVGVLAYDFNLFGSGEYAMYVTGEFSGTVTREDYKPLDPDDCDNDGLPDDPKEKEMLCSFEYQYQLLKPETELVPEGDKLTIATFNVENLSGQEGSNSGSELRFQNLGLAIGQKLKCPDILTLVEIQDNDGPLDENPLDSGVAGSDADASKTLGRLIDNIRECPKDLAYDYKPINVNPFENSEGGEPGGNIRVAMIYNAERVSFKPRGVPGPASETYIDETGSLKFNPGRVAPFDPRLDGARKPIAAEFMFRGEQVFVVGNHFNSKRGDTSLWSASQPPVFGSEGRRTDMADTVSEFVQEILVRKPGANIAVMGDFNDFNETRALKSLEGTWLKNLANVTGDDGLPLVDPNDQYTYNFGGNSQPLDFILVSEGLQRKNPELHIVHLNSDYMLQISDHDPVVSRFDFSVE